MVGFPDLVLFELWLVLMGWLKLPVLQPES
jgi:hypothetical protein